MLLSLRNVSAVLSLLAATSLAPNARADGGAVIPLPMQVRPVVIGDSFPPDTAFYDNTTETGYYYAPPTGAVPCEVADDVPFTGTYHVDSIVFEYATTNTNDHEVTINVFYGALNADDSPAGPPVQSVDLIGFPGSPDGSLQAYQVVISLTDLSLDFDWTNSVSADGTYDFNWVGFTFSQGGAGLVTASGGGSMDEFWTNKDQRSPYGSGSFFWYFGGTPTASFYLQISGFAQ